MVAISLIAVLLLTMRSPGTQAENLSALDPSAHLGNASFALVAPHSVLAANGQFTSLAGGRYVFRYADAANFTNVQNSTFIVIVINSSNDVYAQLALKAINITELDNALNYTKGAMISKENVWGRGQTVFMLIGYNASSLSSALSSFFVKSPVYAPRQFSARFVNESGRASGDPIMDAVLDGTYELSPHDSSLSYPYSYYENFAYLIYYAPVITSAVPGVEGNASGTGLPMSAPMCIPPPPPEDGSSICVGDYVAMPMLQVGSASPLRPQWSYDTGDCNFFGIDDCIDAEGWAASGLNPQLPYSEIPSVYFGVTSSGSPVPPSMDGTFGPVSDSLPITWWIYGPGSYGESTGGFQSSMSGVMNESEKAILINAGVQMFSAPIGETPVGNFTMYNSTNSPYTYSCGSEVCGMRFNYTIYALLNVSSTIPDNTPVMSPHWYSPALQLNYSPVLEPVSLSTPKVVRTSAKTYYFSYWSVYSELAGNQYYNRYNTSNVTFQLIGPTQAEAIYTTAGVQQNGSITISAGFVPSIQGCRPIENCSIPGVMISVIGPNGNEVYSNTTGVSGQVVTPVLASGCYQVTAQKPGYVFVLGPNPVCVNGHADVMVQTWSPLIYNVSWPGAYPYGMAPVSSTMQINLTLLYTEHNLLAGNVIVGVHAGAGTVIGSYPSPSNGTLCWPFFNGFSGQTVCHSVKNNALGLTSPINATTSFVWHTGSRPGLYYLNFTPLVTSAGVPFPPMFGSTYGWTYSMPVVLYSGSNPKNELNISLANGTVYASQGSTLVDNITVKLCRTFEIGFNKTLPCMPLTPYAANMSLTYTNDRPANTTAVFVPDPAPANSESLSGTTSLHMSLGRSVRNGLYVARITSVMQTANATYNATVPLFIYVSTGNSTITTTVPPINTSTTTTVPSASGYGALNVTVFFNGIPVAAAAVRAFSPGAQIYSGWYTGSNGEYNTGYIITPDSYEVDGTYDNITNSTNYLNVSAGKVTYVDIYIYGIATTTTSTISSTSTSSITSTSSSSTTTTAQSGYYECNYCYHVPEAGFTCPSTCPTSVSCNYGGFKCT